MNASKLDQRISIIEPIRTKSAMGGDIETSEVRARLWAGYRYLKGREYTEANAKNNSAEAVFMVRASSFTSTIRRNWQILHDGEVWDIVDIAPMPSGRPVKFDLTVKRNAI